MRYEKEGRELVLEARRRARDMGHSYVGSGHLLLALAAGKSPAGNLLRCCGADPVRLELAALALMGRGREGLPLPQGLTVNARRILRGAAEEAGFCGRRGVTPMHILLALSRREAGIAGGCWPCAGWIRRACFPERWTGWDMKIL